MSRGQSDSHVLYSESMPGIETEELYAELMATMLGIGEPTTAWTICVARFGHDAALRTVAEALRELRKREWVRYTRDGPWGRWEVATYPPAAGKLSAVDLDSLRFEFGVGRWQVGRWIHRHPTFFAVDDWEGPPPCCSSCAHEFVEDELVWVVDSGLDEEICLCDEHRDAAVLFDCA